MLLLLCMGIRSHIDSREHKLHSNRGGEKHAHARIFRNQSSSRGPSSNSCSCYYGLNRKNSAFKPLRAASPLPQTKNGLLHEKEPSCSAPVCLSNPSRSERCEDAEADSICAITLLQELLNAHSILNSILLLCRLNACIRKEALRIWTMSLLIQAVSHEFRRSLLSTFPVLQADVNCACQAPAIIGIEDADE